MKLRNFRLLFVLLQFYCCDVFGMDLANYEVKAQNPFAGHETYIIISFQISSYYRGFTHSHYRFEQHIFKLLFLGWGSRCSCSSLQNVEDFMKNSQIISSIMSRTATNAYFATQAHKHIGISKTDATIPNYEAVIIGAIEKAKLSVEKINFLVHGTPVIINCLTERKGAKIGLITTTGFRDILETGRGNRPDFFNLNYVKPVPSWSDISYGNERTSKPQRRGALSTRPLKICSQSSPTSTKTTSEASQSVS